MDGHDQSSSHDNHITNMEAFGVHIAAYACIGSERSRLF